MYDDANTAIKNGFAMPIYRMAVGKRIPKFRNRNDHYHFYNNKRFYCSIFVGLIKKEVLHLKSNLCLAEKGTFVTISYL